MRVRIFDAERNCDYASSLIPSYLIALREYDYKVEGEPLSYRHYIEIKDLQDLLKLVRYFSETFGHDLIIAFDDIQGFCLIIYDAYIE